MTQELKDQLDHLTNKARITTRFNGKNGAVKFPANSSLHRIINSQDKADFFMKLLEAVWKQTKK